MTGFLVGMAFVLAGAVVGFILGSAVRARRDRARAARQGHHRPAHHAPLGRARRPGPAPLANEP
jgi:hypothetical protein